MNISKSFSFSLDLELADKLKQACLALNHPEFNRDYHAMIRVDGLGFELSVSDDDNSLRASILLKKDSLDDFNVNSGLSFKKTVSLPTLCDILLDAQEFTAHSEFLEIFAEENADTISFKWGKAYTDILTLDLNLYDSWEELSEYLRVMAGILEGKKGDEQICPGNCWPDRSACYKTLSGVVVDWMTTPWEVAKQEIQTVLIS